MLNLFGNKKRQRAEAQIQEVFDELQEIRNLLYDLEAELTMLRKLVKDVYK